MSTAEKLENVPPVPRFPSPGFRRLLTSLFLFQLPNPLLGAGPADVFRPVYDELDAPPVAVSRVGRDAVRLKRFGGSPDKGRH